MEVTEEENSIKKTYLHVKKISSHEKKSLCNIKKAQTRIKIDIEQRVSVTDFALIELLCFEWSQLKSEFFSVVRPYIMSIKSMVQLTLWINNTEIHMGWGDFAAIYLFCILECSVIFF